MHWIFLIKGNPFQMDIILQYLFSRQTFKQVTVRLANEGYWEFETSQDLTG